MSFEYIPKTEKQLRNNFTSRVRENLNEFKDFEDFLNWYNSQEKECHYCGLTEIESQKLVMTGILKSSRFPENGIIKQGKARGVWLEVDRLQPKEKYSRNNCVLCCYFCNNDKSDVFSSADYLKFRENRILFLKNKLL